MDISGKIEEIRQRPEHIRIRYVWGSVAISMFFIIIIWIFSLEESFKNIRPADEEDLAGMKQGLEELRSIGENAPSISDMGSALNGASGLKDAGIKNQEEKIERYSPEGSANFPKSPEENSKTEPPPAYLEQ